MGRQGLETRKRKRLRPDSKAGRELLYVSRQQKCLFNPILTVAHLFFAFSSFCRYELALALIFHPLPAGSGSFLRMRLSRRRFRRPSPFFSAL
jgi:hypothetical protein